MPPSTRTVCFLLSAAAILCSCSDDWAPRLAWGTRVPDARFEVRLSEPAKKLALFKTFELAARFAEYEKFQGRPRTREDGTGHKPSMFTWETNEGSPHYPNSVSFMFPRGVEYPMHFIVIFRQPNTDRFEATEWRRFYEWKDDVIPEFFPDAEVTVTRHPASFTSYMILMEVSKETGIPVPQKTREQYEEWLAEQTD